MSLTLMVLKLLSIKFWECFGDGQNLYNTHRHTQISKTLFLGFHISFPFYFTFTFFPESIPEAFVFAKL